MLINPHATDELTLAERGELERQYDGPIPQSAVDDKIRARTPAEVEPIPLAEIPARIAKLMGEASKYGWWADYYRREYPTLSGEIIANQNTALMIKCLDEVSELERRLEMNRG